MAVVLSQCRSIIEAVLCGVLATGLFWSHIRRRITGQVDTDELDG